MRLTFDYFELLGTLIPTIDNKRKNNSKWEPQDERYYKNFTYSKIS